MTTERETLRIIGSWMEDGRSRLPDHVLDAVLDQLPSTPQHRPAWSARRITLVNAFAKYAIAAAAVVVVAIAGLNILGGSGVGDQPSPSPTSTPSPTATPRTVPAGVLEPGSYVAHPLPAPADALAVTFTVPEGWEAFGDPGGLELSLIPSSPRGTGSPGGIAVQLLDVTSLYGDPCSGLGTDDDVNVGTAVDDLVEALLVQTAYEVSDPIDVAIGGHSGRRVDIVVPTEPFLGQTAEAPECEGNEFRLWSTTGYGPNSIYVQGPANRWQANILDIDGTRLVVVVQDFPATSAADRAELDAIVESLVIEP